MARNPPNKPSKHRQNPKTPTSSGNIPKQRPGRVNTSQRLSELAPQTSTPLHIPVPSDQPHERTLSSSHSAGSLSSSNSTPGSSGRPQIPPIPRPPENENRRRCLEPLNLGPSLQTESMVDGRNAANIENNNFMARIEAFFEQQKKFNERLEQRVTENLTNERENLTTPLKKRLPKELSVSRVHVPF